MSYYFDSKENLYRTCLELFGRANFANAERVLKPPTSQQEFRLRLQLFSEEFILLNQSEPDICKILHRDIDKQNHIVHEIFKESFLPMHSKLEEFVIAAKKNGILRKDIDAQISTDLIFGSLVQLVRMDSMRLKLFGKSLLAPNRIDHTLNQFIEFSIRGVFGKEVK